MAQISEIILPNGNQYDLKDKLAAHVVFSQTQPTTQKTGDVWVIIEEVET